MFCMVLEISEEINRGLLGTRKRYLTASAFAQGYGGQGGRREELGTDYTDFTD